MKMPNFKLTFERKLKAMKEKMITRTIVSTNYTVMCVDVATAKVDNRLYSFAGVRDDAKCLSIINDLYKETTDKAVAVISAEEVETLYGMPESVFMKYAVVLPPRGTKKEQEEG